MGDPYVECPECGHQQPDMGNGVACEECGYAPLFSHTCSDGQNDGGTAECSACSVMECPHGEPLHHHHDGCPMCSQKEAPRE